MRERVENKIEENKMNVEDSDSVQPNEEREANLTNSRDGRYSLNDSRNGGYNLRNSRDEGYSLNDSRDGTYTKNKMASYSGSTSSVKAKVQRHLSSTPSSPEANVEIPRDGSLLSFTTKDIVTILICLNIHPEVINRVNKMRVNGKKLSAMSNDDLKELDIDNPIIRYFRDKTKLKSKSHFML